MTRNIIFIALFITMGTSLIAAEGDKLLYNGNKSYKTNNYKEAEIDYRKSLETNPNSNIARYNLANSLYKQGNYTEAMEKFKELSNENFSKQELSKVFHNLGNSLLEEKKYEESIDSYINSLKNNPKDEDTKYNLAYAREMLRKQQQDDKDKDKDNQDQDKDKKDQDKKDQNKDQNGDKNKDKQNQDKGDENKDKQDQDKKDQNGEKDKDKESENKDGKDGQQDENKTENKDQSQNGQKPKISKQDAERILQAMMNDEKELQKKLRKLKSNSNKKGKNW